MIWLAGWLERLAPLGIALLLDLLQVVSCLPRQFHGTKTDAKSHEQSQKLLDEGLGLCLLP